MSEIIYGIHAIQSLLERDPQRFLSVYFLKERHDRRLQQLISQFKDVGIVVRMAKSRWWLDQKSEGKVHQGIIAIVKENKQLHEKDLQVLLVTQAIPLLLLLDGITDPYNFGACLRCADAAGVHAVIVLRDRAAPLNAITKKVASGAAETVPVIRVTNLARTLRFLQEKKVWIVGTDNNANNNLYQCKLTGPLAIVIGAEDKGMRWLTRKYCNELISIPMAGKISSLNVSVATGICLFEAVRQRSKIFTL